MKSYLSLIPVYAKVHRRQNRMTIFCIVCAVFLVTAVFSMAEMGARMEQARLQEKHGSLSFQELFDSTMGKSLLITAGILFLLILLAGVLMIAGSINSSVAQRTEFFGMMRCIGMSRRQVMRFVKLEALNWCKTSIPIGVVLGILSTWCLCAVLRFLVGEEFSEIPLFGISIPGIVSGIVVGAAAVLLAARAPAKRAAGVSPAAAVSGNSGKNRTTRRSARIRFVRVETALGIRHAVSAKKNLILITGSFALSIILFLSFSVLIDFVDCLMPQSSAAPDLEISSMDGTNSIDSGLKDRLCDVKGVKHVYGRRSCLDISARFKGSTEFTGAFDLVSFDGFDLEALEKDGMLKAGSDLSRVRGDGRCVLAVWDPDSPWEIGDKILTDNGELEIAGLLKYNPFSGNGLTDGTLTLIVSGETFVRLTGVKDYSLIMVQLSGSAADEEVQAIRSTAGSAYRFSDKRDQRTTGTYLAFVFCVYSFLVLIALVTVLNIVNSISMSVSARIRQYGAMRAAGMENRQMKKMIAAEACTYAAFGCTAGCAAGLLLSRLLYEVLITAHFPYQRWGLPVSSLIVIFLFVSSAAAVAVCAPAKRISSISIVEAINEL